MYKELYEKINNLLKEEFDNVKQNESDISKKIEKMNDLFNVVKVIDSFDELESTFVKFFEEKRKKDKEER